MNRLTKALASALSPLFSFRQQGARYGAHSQGIGPRRPERIAVITEAGGQIDMQPTHPFVGNETGEDTRRVGGTTRPAPLHRTAVGRVGVMGGALLAVPGLER